MDKSLFFFIVIGIGFLYFITNFVGDIQEDEKFQNEEYKQKHQFDQYQTVDSIGREILDMTDAPASIQVQAWNNSKLKIEFLELFPDFSEMKIFVKERLRGDILQAKLIASIDSVESQYFSGKMNAEQAKRELSLLK
ncbi:hypothetical protein MN086_10905 [Sulfurovum sp. XGS-02]|uniref:hypothetical protein n=1 Tax=Sulfurovum sp. XGS-02 TaxID=2925411 RepID=UPI00204B9A22|nr:hypothetical protein [Sulfurovum sp. XGS-02]UPT77542.1 hypothetical protein MN086_10905 [Sulfurovum sp. XGS-02]